MLTSKAYDANCKTRELWLRRTASAWGMDIEQNAACSITIPFGVPVVPDVNTLCLRIRSQFCLVTGGAFKNFQASRGDDVWRDPSDNFAGAKG